MSGILNRDTIDLIKRVSATADWRDQSDLERRRAVGAEFRSIVEASGVLQDEPLTHEVLAKLISCQWQVQNLNALPLTKLMGLYAYKKYFADYAGSKADLEQERLRDTGSSEMHEGADLAVMGHAIKLLASNSVDDHIRGANDLIAAPGAGQALASGFLLFLHPSKYALINGPTKAALRDKNTLSLTKHHLRAAGEAFVAEHPSANDHRRAMNMVFRWQVILNEIRAALGLEDFHEVDQLLWRVANHDRAAAKLAEVDYDVEAQRDDAATRKAAEDAARRLVSEKLGRLKEADLRDVFRHLNTSLNRKGETVYSRFSPAFVGSTANDLVAQLDQLNPWIEKLWTADHVDIEGLLNSFWGSGIFSAGRSFPSALLYLRDPTRYAVWTSTLDKALYSQIPGLPAKHRSGAGYLTYCAGVQRLLREVDVPPQLHDHLLWTLVERGPKKRAATQKKVASAFSGFDADAFSFLSELGDNNNDDWFHANKKRFTQSVDRPLRSLVTDVGSQVVAEIAPELETAARANKTIARMRKNVWGQKTVDVYNPYYWAAFYRRDRKKTTDAQLFLDVMPYGFSMGFFVPAGAPDVAEVFLDNLRRLPELAAQVIGTVQEAGFVGTEETDDYRSSMFDLPESPERWIELQQAKGGFVIRRHWTSEEAVAAGPALAEEVGKGIRALYPLFVLATDVAAADRLEDLLAGQSAPTESIDEDDAISLQDLAEATFLEESFFTRLQRLLEDKGQLIFSGPPGTGKTHVALQYAAYLAQGGGDVRVVQFHPTYAYEDFIEGLRPVVEDGALSYRVVPGIFGQLCERARANPASTFVLVIDEINRGNLPKIFGELLFLLEKRTQVTQLPYSKKDFSVPGNVVVLGTMNTADRSVALMDLALRRRFHFVELGPRSDVLASWLQKGGHPAHYGRLFELLNEELSKAGIDRDRLVGHSHFMTDDLDEERLELTWEATIEPTLRELFFAEPDRLRQLALDVLLARVETASGPGEGEEEEEEDPEADDFE